MIAEKFNTEKSFLTWTAFYNDKTQLSQYEGEVKNDYASIDRSKLEVFNLYKHSGERVFSVVLEEGQKLIFRKRIITPVGGEPIAVYLCGWQQNTNGKNVQSIAYLFEDGVIELRGAFQGDHALFGNIELIDQEK